jgi:hypothetical protein
MLRMSSSYQKEPTKSTRKTALFAANQWRKFSIHDSHRNDMTLAATDNLREDGKNNLLENPQNIVASAADGGFRQAKRLSAGRPNPKITP